MSIINDKLELLHEATVAVEMAVDAAIADAAQQEPYRMLLAVSHPCCHCGKVIPEGTVAVATYMPVRVDEDHLLQLITWCDEDWTTHFGPLDQVPDYNRLTEK